MTPVDSLGTRIVLVAAPRSGAGLLQGLWCLDDRWSPSGLSSGDLDVSAAWADSAEMTVDWAPKSALRIPLMAAADPHVKFVRVARDPRRAVPSLVQAWRSGRFVSEPELEGWWGEPWSFPLIPDWQELAGKPLHEVAAVQWLTIDARVRDDLASVDPARVVTVRFEELIADPAAEMARVTAELGVEWSAEIPDPLPLSPLTVMPPDESKWQGEAHETLAAFEAQPHLHQAFLAEASERGWVEYVEPLTITREPVLASQVTRPSEGTAFSSQHSSTLVELLHKARASLVISTYKSGHVIFARAGEEKLDTHVFGFNRPMGMAVDGPRLAIGTGLTIESYWNQANLAARVDPEQRQDRKSVV